MPLTWNALFIGTFTDLDPFESTVSTELQFGSGATFGSAANPLASQQQTFTVDDADNNGVWNRDNGNSGAPETATLDTGGGTQTVVLDSAQVYSATITYFDGTTANVSAVLFQLSDGRTYIAPELSANADDAAYNAAPIRSITLNFLIQDTTNLNANRRPGDFVCFVKGTRLLTPIGNIAIEDLQCGDQILTLDSGPQTVRWIGTHQVYASGEEAPIQFAQNALGASAEFCVSPQHRMLISGWRAELLFGESEVLVPAKALVNDTDILRAESGLFKYYHIMFDNHQIIFANNVPSESYHPGEYGFSVFEDETKQEILSIFPELRQGLGKYAATARPILTVSEGRLLA